MTIDEAIAQIRKNAESFRNMIVPNDRYYNMPWIDVENSQYLKFAEEQEQLAKWLEELKAYRECNVCEYNKAIDDFAEKIIQRYHELPTTLGYTEEIVKEIAEQLKAGGEND